MNEREKEKEYRFLTRCCDDSPPLSFAMKGDAINEMTDRARQITYATLASHCKGLQRIEAQLGYDSRLKMSNDPYVSFWKGTFMGGRAYYFDHSRIEHIFIHKDDLKIVKANMQAKADACSNTSRPRFRG